MTLPKDGVIYVCDHDEVFKIVFGNLSEPKILDDAPYKFLEKLPHSLGISNYPPPLESNGNSISYKFYSAADFVVVSYEILGAKVDLEFRTYSGDWFAASFPKCDKYLMLAEPYSFELYVTEGSNS
ncbi:hypothetical protein [Pseudomonas sp. HMWF032]|uniref:hypothetical protein n=1 Tax=Pseudomonas sp. HMWF032 TaxID=2056866 RepID=UPI0011B1F81B|nr:hypothetical protein [Pseudomonas sp. HMWF032]